MIITTWIYVGAFNKIKIFIIQYIQIVTSISFLIYCFVSQCIFKSSMKLGLNQLYTIYTFRLIMIIVVNGTYGPSNRYYDCIVGL